MQEPRKRSYRHNDPLQRNVSRLRRKRHKRHQSQQPIALQQPLYTGYFDGSCGPINPGGTAAYGAVLLREGERIWECSALFQPEPGKERQTSNNLAEYCGLIALLEHLIHLGAQQEPIMLYGDSNLVIQQVFGHWHIKAGIYAPYAHKAQALRRTFAHLGGQWIPRTKNTMADALSKAPLLKAGVLPSIRLGNDEEDTNADRDSTLRSYTRLAASDPEPSQGAPRRRRNAHT
jgi:ribonuclease HI